MSSIKSTIQDLLLAGSRKIDMEWISFEMNVPLDLVESVLSDMEHAQQEDIEYLREYADN